MPEQFDPYYKWLGIPPKDQPPNHYRLLGIELFEDNAEVIETAAERQATYLHEVSSGPNVKESQKLLNEIAAARICLLDPEKKAAYDTKLKSKIAVSVSVDALPGQDSPLDDLPWDNLESLMTNGSSSDTTPRAHAASETLRLPSADPSGVFKAPASLLAAKPEPQEKAKTVVSKSPKLWLAVGGVAALVIAAAALAILLSNSGREDELLVTEQPGPESPEKSVTDKDPKANGQPDKKDDKRKQPDKVPNVPDRDKPKVDEKKDGDKKDGGKKPPDGNQNNDNKQPVKPETTNQTDDNNGTKNGTNVQHVSAKPPVVEKQPIRTKGFEALKPGELTSLTGGTTFTVLDDKSVLAEGGGDDDVYTIQLTTEIPDITAIRVEALPHDSLPFEGPGLGKEGGFSIFEVRVLAASARNAGDKVLVPLTGVESKESPASIERLIDGDAKRFWAVRDRGKPTSFTLFAKTPIWYEGGTILVVQLAQHEKLGHFLVSVSNDPDLAGKETRIEAELPLLVNLGGQAKKDQVGRIWQASQVFDGGAFGYVGGMPEGNDSLVPLSSCISGIKEFRATLQDGKYDVRLFFSGRMPQNASRRAFHVSALGVKKQTVKNISASRPLVQLVLSGAEAKNGGLIIEFESDKGEPFLNGISIEKAQ